MYKSFETPARTSTPDPEEAFARRYRRVPQEHLPTLRQALALSERRALLAETSVDATDIAKQTMMETRNEQTSIEAANDRLEAWRVAQLESRDGQPFVARVPVFSPWRNAGETDYRYFAIDQSSGLHVDPARVGNLLVRDYIDGAELFSTTDQEYLRPIIDDPEYIGNPRRSDTTWEEATAYVNQGVAKLAEFPEITDVVIPEQPSLPE